MSHSSSLIDASPLAMSDEVSCLVDLLDRCHRQLLDLDLGSLDEFVVALRDLRLGLSRDEWHRFRTEIVDGHPLQALLHEEPFTRRAFEKPCGYPGDAPLLDLIYGESRASDMSQLGERLHRWAAPHTGFLSVRERRDILAAALDLAATERSQPRVLALACGHLREAQRSVAFQDDAIGEIVAVDQDSRSLAVVSRELRSAHVTPLCVSMREFLFNPLAYGTFDLVYAAGLYDYLDDRVARKLTASMFAALRPHGRLLVANFAPTLREIGYMEAVMDWNLIYRNASDVSGFAAGIPTDAIQRQTITADTFGNIIYLSIRKW
ncbi:MAG: class I SAM-dependent methyltransferase [bacterium]